MKADKLTMMARRLIRPHMNSRDASFAEYVEAGLRDDSPEVAIAKAGIQAGLKLAAAIAIADALPKQRWSCSDDESGTGLTLNRQRCYTYSQILGAVGVEPSTSFTMSARVLVDYTISDLPIHKPWVIELARREEYHAYRDWLNERLAFPVAREVDSFGDQPSPYFTAALSGDPIQMVMTLMSLPEGIAIIGASAATFKRIYP